MELLQLVLYVAYTVLASIIALLTIYTGYIFYIHRKYDHLPIPKGRWFYFGHIPLVLAHVNKGKVMWDLFYDWTRDCGTVFVLWQFHKPIVVVADAECIKLLAASASKSKSSVAPVVKTMKRQRLLGNSLVTIHDKTRWKIRRRNYDSSFTKSYLHQLVPQFNEVIQRHFIATLRAAAENKVPVELKSQFNNIALEVISWVAFKTDFTKEPYTRTTGGDSLSQIISTILKGVLLEVMNPFAPYLKPYEAQMYVNSARKLREIGRQCIEVKLKELENSDELPNDIISNILMVTQKEKDITMEDLVDDFLAFYIAGYESTSNTLAFTIATLLQNPKMMEIAITEVDEIMNGKDSVDHEDIDKMTYITSVLEEILRLYPIAPAVDKLNDQELTFGSYIIPKQSEILVSSYITHRMPEHFDEPLKFDPNRFGPHSNRPTPYVYFPFGIGQRSCIGRAFSMIEAKVAIALLLHNFTLSLVDDYEMVVEDVSSLRPKHDIRCTVMSRVN